MAKARNVRLPETLLRPVEDPTNQPTQSTTTTHLAAADPHGTAAPLLPVRRNRSPASQTI